MKNLHSDNMRAEEKGQPARKKQTIGAPLNLTLYHSQDPAMKEFEAKMGAFLVKYDMKSFACHPSRDEFIEEWCARPEENPLPIYEVIVDGFARLHFDVEAHPGPAPSPEELREWLFSIINIIKEAR